MKLHEHMVSLAMRGGCPVAYIHGGLYIGWIMNSQDTGGESTAGSGPRERTERKSRERQGKELESTERESQG